MAERANVGTFSIRKFHLFRTDDRTRERFLGQGIFNRDDEVTYQFILFIVRCTDRSHST